MSFGLEVALADGVNQVNANSRPLVVKYEAIHDLSTSASVDVAVPEAVIGDVVCIQAQIYVTSPSQLWGGGKLAYQDDSIARAYVISGGTVRVQHPVSWYLTDELGGARSNNSTLFKIVVLG